MWETHIWLLDEVLQSSLQIEVLGNDLSHQVVLVVVINKLIFFKGVRRENNFCLELNNNNPLKIKKTTILISLCILFRLI